MSRKELNSSLPIRGYRNPSDGGADGVHITPATGGSKSVEPYVAGRDIPLSAISVKSTAEMV